MLPEVVWSMPPGGTINLHGSLLPQYRGAAPINRAIMNGEKETGLTTFFINENIDTGAIIDSVKCPIGPDETAGELHDKMTELGADLLVKTVGEIEKGEAESIPQPESGKLKPAPKIFKDDCKIDWSKPAAEIHNHIRGLSPYPAAFTSVEGADFDRMKIFRTEITNDGAQSPGSVRMEDGFIFVDASDRKLKVLDLQVPGKKRMSSSVFLNGFTPPENFKLI
jgi:methionyl-tRNA formyltransferase